MCITSGRYGPLPISILDSKTIPVALESKSVFKSKISDCNNNSLN